MSEKPTRQSFPGRFPSATPAVTKVSGRELVRARTLDPDAVMPLIIEPAVEDVDPVGWATERRESLLAQLNVHGAILFRGFRLADHGAFDRFATALCPARMDYHERAAPRNEVAKKVFTSTEFPSDQSIPMHHEMSYSHNWPQRLLFFCEQPSADGGATPVADDRVVFAALDEEIKRRFLEKRVMYVRNYGPGLDLSWQDVYQTDDRDEVERYCRDVGIDFEWRGDDRLRTRQVRQAVATHPQTGDTVWFNHAHLFHSSNMPADVREALVADLGPEGLPRNALYGDGSPIDTATVEEIRATYERHAVRFPWRKGDVMLVDNFLVVHGRDPYSGPRKVLVAMADLFTSQIASGVTIDG